MKRDVVWIVNAVNEMSEWLSVQEKDLVSVTHIFSLDLELYRINQRMLIMLR